MNEIVSAIKRVDEEIKEVKEQVKTGEENLVEVIESLPEHKAVLEAEQTLEVAKTKLKIALENNSSYNVVKEELAETKFKLRDLKEILSHHLVGYFKETGEVQLDEGDHKARQIIITGKLGKTEHYQERIFKKA